MKNKIIVGLAFATPFTAMALELNGNHTYTEEINIPVTHNWYEVNGIKYSGIEIQENSNTTFTKNVTINEPNESHNNDFNKGIRAWAITGSSNTIFNGDLNINLLDGYAIGIDMGAINSSITVNGKTTINVDDKEDSEAINIDDGILTLNGESLINGDIFVFDTAILKINNKSIINGDIEAYDGGVIELHLQSGSKITGSIHSNADPDYPEDDAGTLIMDLAKNASWDITSNNSYITQLSGQGNIRFINDNLNNTYANNTNNFGQLVIENLKGSSNFDLRTDIVNKQSDKIIVTNSAEGTHTINLTNNGASNTTGKEILTLVEIDNNATNSANFKTNHAVELGGYQYDLNKEGNNFVLTGHPITSSAMASTGFLNANYLMSYVETQTLLKRLGDMRNSGEFGDVWLRGFSGKLDSFAGGKLSKFDMSYHGFQFGADKQLSDNSPFVVGAFVGQTYGDPDYRKGDGSLRSFNTGLYTSYLDNNGLYIDAVGKYARQRNHFKVKDTANNRVQGTGHTNGLGLSMELGKKFNFNEFYIEPQTQLSYSHQNGTTVNATNGLRVKLGDYNSLIGRASALFGYEIRNENNNINLYAKTGIVREFDGDTYYKLNNSKESHSFKGNWWNNGVGVSANINHQHTIYFDLESSPGNKFDLLQVNGGYRYSF
ncbi:autotransporter outer membrane beta-barrel domain-containing protein [Gilliamella sp. wkB112]|uniref:autotransporter outer membrane beta-barrel domain-containing protein n=1 Tax=Gilliamella sp. wkB112 TaxID=3120257 RepID=UPI00080E8267|nr:autotransporter outer membrane beta-barrel domain-containing protein [Gilliamella apicola]OCG03179.1 hypothetical protein A9G12_09730 [Gilliamella apicola]